MSPVDSSTTHSALCLLVGSIGYNVLQVATLRNMSLQEEFITFATLEWLPSEETRFLRGVEILAQRTIVTSPMRQLSAKELYNLELLTVYFPSEILLSFSNFNARIVNSHLEEVKTFWQKGVMIRSRRICQYEPKWGWNLPLQGANYGKFFILL